MKTTIPTNILLLVNISKALIFDKLSLSRDAATLLQTLRVKSEAQCGSVCESAGQRCGGFIFDGSPAWNEANCHLYRCINTDFVGVDELPFFVARREINVTNVALSKLIFKQLRHQLKIYVTNVVLLSAQNF